MMNTEKNIKDKKWSNSLNKPWYRNEPSIVGVCDLEDNVINTNNFIDMANENIELAIHSADIIEEFKKISKKILEGESERNIRERKKEGLKDGEYELSGNFKINQAMYEMNEFLSKLKIKDKK